MTNTSASLSVYKIDRFTVPSAVVADFATRLRLIQEALQEQPGCLQNLVLAGSRTGEGSQEFATVVEWESEEAFQFARVAIQQRYSSQGFDPAAFMRNLGVKASMGVFRTLAQSD